MGTAQEMADGVVFPASPAVRFITGTNLVIDGAPPRGVQLAEGATPAPADAGAAGRPRYDRAVRRPRGPRR